MLKVVQDLRTLADSVQALCLAATEGLSEGKNEAAEVKPVKAEEPTITLEKVRGVLAQKSEAGFTAEVRSIIQKYGANRLREIDPKDYKAMIADAEVIGNE